jgi:hypothetical protein
MNERLLTAKAKELSRIATWAFETPVSVSIVVSGRHYCDKNDGHVTLTSPSYFMWLDTPDVKPSGVGHNFVTWKDVLCAIEWLKDVKREVSYRMR